MALMVVSASLQVVEGGEEEGVTSTAINANASASESFAAAAPASVAATAATTGVGELARGVSVVLGPLAGQAFALGLCAAGLSSAITAPLAARLAVEGLVPSQPALGTFAWLTVAVAGTVIAALPAVQPVGVILVAQCLNAVLLPLLGGTLVVVASQTRLLGSFRYACHCTSSRAVPSHFRWSVHRCHGHVCVRRRNGPLAITAGGSVVALTCALSLKSLAAGM